MKASLEQLLSALTKVANSKMVTEHTFRRRDKTYDVYKLWELADKIPSTKLPIDSPEVRHFMGVRSWTGKRSPREILKSKDDTHGHMARIRKADLRRPIILTPNWGVADGLHRLAKAVKAGKKHVRVRHFESWEDMQPALVKKVAAAKRITVRPMTTQDEKRWELQPDVDLRKKQYEYRIATGPKNTLLGFATINPKTRTVRNLWVEPKARRQGVATKLLSAFSVEPTRLHVYAENDVAKNLYRRLGFEKKRSTFKGRSELWIKKEATKDPARWEDPVIFAPHAKMTKQDLFDYYGNKAVKKRILDAVGKTETIIRQSFDPQNMILRRKDGHGRFIELLKNYDKWNNTRMSEVHPTFGPRVDFVLADIDPQSKVPWKKAKGITETVAKTMANHPDIKNVEVQFSGGRGFYVKGFTRKDMDVDKARSMTQEILQGIAARPDVTFGVADADQIRLDTSPLKRRGSVRAPYSLNAATGLVSAPVKIEDLPDIQKEDFTVDKILGAIVRRAVKRASAESSPGIPQSRKVETLPHLRSPRDWTMVVQVHDAKRAGKHWDLRLVDPKTEMAHSFAVPKGRLPGKKDRMLLAIQQPTHTANYALTFEGDIPAGTYGAGKVEQKIKEKVRVLKSSDNKLQFERLDGEKFTLFRTQGTNWGIIRNN